MQTELDMEALPIGIDILGVNGVGLESGNAAVCSGRTIPWLQDTADATVWTSWAVNYRDVIVLDVENRPVAVYNLSAHNLSQPEDYAELKAILIGAASGN